MTTIVQHAHSQELTMDKRSPTYANFRITHFTHRSTPSFHSFHSAFYLPHSTFRSSTFYQQPLLLAWIASVTSITIEASAKGVRQCMLSDDQNMCMVHCYFLRLFHVCEFRRLFSLAFSRVKAILLDFCLVPTVMLSCMFMAMLQLAVNLVISWKMKSIELHSVFLVVGWDIIIY